MDTPNILVIDGDPKNLQILRESLESSNFRVTTISNGAEAWGIIQSRRPDIIVAELDLPGLNCFELLERLQRDPGGATIPLVFLTSRRNIEDRLKSFRSGVKDYMIKPLHVKEVIARLQMILRRIDRMSTQEPEANRKVVGRLEEKSLDVLIENFGSETRTGVLVLYDQNDRSGEIYFRDGAVVNARLGNFKGEKAVYQMLPWKSGHFIMTFKDIQMEDAITVSNLGLLLQGFKRLQERDQLLKDLPALDTIFVRTALFEQILKKKTISADAYKFVGLFDGERRLSDIIAESMYDDVKTLEKMVKLYQQGLIRPKDSKEAKHPELSKSSMASPPKEQFTPKIAAAKTARPTTSPVREEKHILADENHHQQVNKTITADGKKVQERARKPLEMEPPFGNLSPPKRESRSTETTQTYIEPSSVNGTSKRESQPAKKMASNDLPSIFESLFNGRSQASGRLVVIGTEAAPRQKLISMLTKGEYQSKKLDASGALTFEFGKIVTSGKQNLEIIGVSTEREFLQMLEKFSSSMVGYIVLLGAQSLKNLGYMGYLINSLKKQINLPRVIATMQGGNKKSIPLDVVRYTLRLDENEQLAEVDLQEVDSVKHLLRQLQPPAHPNRPKPQQSDVSYDRV